MKFTRHFTKPGIPISDQIKWKLVDVKIDGKSFEMKGVEVPEGWSQTASNILADKYFRKAGVPSSVQVNWDSGESVPIWLQQHIPATTATFGPETSARWVFHRMAGHWTYVGWKNGYFDDFSGLGNIKNCEEAAQVFYDELFWMLANQIAAPNSPQWFNTGLFWAYGITGSDSGQWAINYPSGEPFLTGNAYEFPQVHACYIQPVSDDLVNPGGIMDLFTREVRLFKQGSGTGSNFSSIRGKGEHLSGGGVSSGLLSFLKIGDVAAGSIASGGVTRRAAKMVCLDLDHPEIEDFIDWKMKEERKARALVLGSSALNDGGEVYSDAFEGEAITTVAGQNANFSVRVTDAFLNAVDQDADWYLTARTTGEVVKTIKARHLWSKICYAAWMSGDPGVQFHDTINKWHTCKTDGKINASNPCSEYMFLDNTACNLASLNLVTTLLPRRNGNRNPGDELDLKSFEHAVRLWTVVLDISVTMASFPSQEIALGSYNYRTLGLGYANAGGLLMRLGLAYDSDEGRDLIASITALMNGISYSTSADLGNELGTFPRFNANSHYTQIVVGRHKAFAQGLATSPLYTKAQAVYDNLRNREFRNAQVTLLAPTGTISFVMDCDTTGIEPDFSLVKHKSLSGGGKMQIVNEAVPEALEKLGYPKSQVAAAVQWVFEHGTLETFKVNGQVLLSPEHLAVFDCANEVIPGGRSLAPMAHVKMVAAVQSFLSGAVSKTVNMPNSATVEDIGLIYREAHRLGVKAVAPYRDGSKMTQPLSTANLVKDVMQVDRTATQTIESALSVMRGTTRRRLPSRARGYRQKLKVDGHTLYFHTGEYEDGTFGEVFIEMSNEGSTVRALVNAFAKAVSIARQYGAPLEVLVDAFVHTKFEPAGIVEGHDRIKLASSVFDAVFRDLAIHYLDQQEHANVVKSITGRPDLDVLLKEATTAFAAMSLEDQERLNEQQRQNFARANVAIDKLATETVSHIDSIIREVWDKNKVPITGETLRAQLAKDVCQKCGHYPTVRTGSCITCPNCGDNSGCG